MVKMAPIEITFSTDSKRLLRELTKQLTMVRNQSDFPLPLEYHDENTMTKVHEAIQKAITENSEPWDNTLVSSNDVVTELQNAGILFRERRPG